MREEIAKAQTGEGFVFQVEAIYELLKGRIQRDGGQLMASLGGASHQGRQRMAAMQEKLGAILLSSLAAEPKIERDLWGEGLEPEGVTDFVLLHLLALLRSPEKDPQPFWIILRRILYHG